MWREYNVKKIRKFTAMMLTVLMLVNSLPIDAMAWSLSDLFSPSEQTTFQAVPEGSETVIVGKTLTLTSTQGSSNHKWSSSDAKIASVSGSGKQATVTGVKDGTVTITHT